MSFLPLMNSIISQYNENQGIIQENNRIYNENMQRLIYFMEELYENQRHQSPPPVSVGTSASAGSGGMNSRTNSTGSPRRIPGSMASSASPRSPHTPLSVPRTPPIEHVYSRRNPMVSVSGAGAGVGSGATGATGSVPLLYLNTPNILRTIIQNAFSSLGEGAATYAEENRAPTEQEIANSTENLVYSSRELRNIETICPISLENFREGANITRIRHCGHIFNRDCLRRWFQTRSMCPVCRHNILSDTVGNDEAAAPAAAAANRATAIERNTIILDNGDEEYEIDIISPRRQEPAADAADASQEAAAQEDDSTTSFMRSLISMLDLSGVTATNISNSRRTTENGNVIDLLYELNIPLGNINER